MNAEQQLPKLRKTIAATALQRFVIRQAHEDDYNNIRTFLIESSDLYPDIEYWWHEHVRPTARQTGRVILVVDSGRSLDGLFIGKPGDSAKLCTLRLRDYARNQGVGRVLVTEGLSRLLKCKPSRFHVTISEGAEDGCAAFFESTGFRRVAVQPDRYRIGVDEFIYSCSRIEIEEVIKNQLAHGFERTLFGSIPKQAPHERTLLMSLRPQFADLMIKGRKTIEFRRRFSKQYEGATIVFYITSPVKQFMFTAVVARVDHQKKEDLWNVYEEDGGISRDLFDRYFSGISHGYAIQLSNVAMIPNQLDLENARTIYPELRPPQSFQTLEPRSPLARALRLPVHV
jgi:predicted transcriptional regulator